MTKKSSTGTPLYRVEWDNREAASEIVFLTSWLEDEPTVAALNDGVLGLVFQAEGRFKQELWTSPKGPISSQLYDNRKDPEQDLARRQLR
ncbi:hypothetical protein ACFL6C_12590 [Myxococcota bacterium]